MHVPDGFINAATSAGAAAVSVGGLAASLKVGAARMREKQIPFAGLSAAVIFALQMLNFPVAAGTSGHLLGGALAAVLLGPGYSFFSSSFVKSKQNWNVSGSASTGPATRRSCPSST